MLAPDLLAAALLGCIRLPLGEQLHSVLAPRRGLLAIVGDAMVAAGQ